MTKNTYGQRKRGRAWSRYRRPSGLPTTFTKNDGGSSTIEFVIWLPIMFALLLVAAQAAMLFMTQANYGSVARDTARLIARHAMTLEEVDEYIASRHLTGGTPEADVTIAGGLVTVTLSKPALEISSIDILDLAEGFVLTASVTQSIEPR